MAAGADGYHKAVHSIYLKLGLLIIRNLFQVLEPVHTLVYPNYI